MLESVPRGADGAVTRAALASPFASAASLEQRTPPRTGHEKLLVSIVQDVLGTEHVAIQDNFFRLGGTSLLCFRVVQQVRASTGQALSPRALLVGTLEQAAAELAMQPAVVAPVGENHEAKGVLGRLKLRISRSAG